MHLSKNIIKVSVILPIYNASKFLKPAIDSILSQTFEDFELLVINDGSTDNSEDIIKEFSDSRIRYFKQENRGVAKTLNFGIKQAKGKYIWRHDADDISNICKLQKQVEFMEQSPAIGLCATQVQFMTENGKVARNFKMPTDAYFNGEIYKKVCFSDFNPYCPITHGTVLVKSEIMRKLDGYRETFITGEDVDAWLRLIQIADAIVLNEALSYHRLSSKSATQVHGWKNEFYRELAKKYYLQRETIGLDELQQGIKPRVPVTISRNQEEIKLKGMFFRSDLIHFLLPLYKDAGDQVLLKSAYCQFFRDGYKLRQTYKAFILSFLNKKQIVCLVRMKSTFFGSLRS
jgi:glycosyltransferase involved in cell wall biosynthesis